MTRITCEHLRSTGCTAESGSLCCAMISQHHCSSGALPSHTGQGLSGRGSARGSHSGVLEVAELISSAGCFSLDVVHDGSYNHGQIFFSQSPLSLPPTVGKDVFRVLNSVSLCHIHSREVGGRRTEGFDWGYMVYCGSNNSSQHVCI